MQQDDNNSLETLEPVGDRTHVVPNALPASAPTPEVTPPSQPKRSLTLRLRQRLSHLNPYLLGFLLLVLLCSIGVYVVVTARTHKVAEQAQSTDQALTSDALAKLKNTDVKIGDPKQVLGIESNTIFAGKVLIRDSLDVAGNLKFGGSLSLPGLTVAGQTTLDQLQTNSLAAAGNVAVQGQMTVSKGLNVAGAGAFSGPLTAPQITVDSLQLTRDLTFSKHLDPGGATPGKADGTALGGGGTSSVSGNDTAGTIAINTGSSPPAGCFITVNFAQRFAGTPHVVIAPTSTAASSLAYYVNRSSSNFSVCTASVPAAAQNYLFDYIVMD